MLYNSDTFDPQQLSVNVFTLMNLSVLKVGWLQTYLHVWDSHSNSEKYFRRYILI